VKVATNIHAIGKNGNGCQGPGSDTRLLTQNNPPGVLGKPA